MELNNKLKEFLKLLKSTKKDGNRVPLGLVIINNKSEYDLIEKSLQFSSSVDLDKETSVPLFISKLKLWKLSPENILTLNVKSADISKVYLEQFKRISNSNHIFIQGSGVEDTYYTEIEPEKPVLATIEEKNLEEIEDPYFLRAFDLVFQFD
jgi:hypothetical protein